MHIESKIELRRHDTTFLFSVECNYEVGSRGEVNKLLM